MSGPQASTVVASPLDLLALDGADLGVTDWAEVTQEQVNLFASATGDHQWIHVDVARATAESPFGGPIAHGYLTLALVNMFLPQLLQVDGTSMGVNLGLDKVRFPAPVTVGSSLRGRGQIIAVQEAKGGVQVTVRVTLELQDPQGVTGTKPACVADTLSRFFP
ncbi:MAG: MaoC family dehydratase [Microthrixaceae bacterium]